MALGLTIRLPNYLEDALKPFEWSGVFSVDFKSSIIHAILSPDEYREDAVNELVGAISLLDFLSAEYKERLTDALLQFGREGFTKAAASG